MRPRNSTGCRSNSRCQRPYSAKTGSGVAQARHALGGRPVGRSGHAHHAAHGLGDLLPGDQVLEIPKHTAGATAVFAPFSNTSFSTGLTYVGERTAYDSFLQFSGTCTGRECLRTYGEFLKANVSVTQALTPRISALLTVENLSNNDDGEQFDYIPSVGRVTTIGVRARL